MKYALPFSFIFFVSCHNYKNGNPSSKLHPFSANDITIKLPKYFQKLSQELLLPDISKGTDSFEIRIWRSLVITDIKTVTIVSCSNNKWHLSEIHYWITNKTNGSTYLVDSSSTYEILPQMSFTNIYDTIRGLHLEKIPYQRDIPNFVDITADGNSYFIEIADKNLYKTLLYINPASYQDPNNKKVAACIEFFNRQHLWYVIPL